MNTRKASAIALARGVVAAVGDDVNRCDVVVIPPFTYLDAVAEIVAGTGISLGAQDVYPADDGAFTGEINASMLADLGVDTVVVGHSERRHVIGEPDAMIAAKLRAVLDHGLRAILCIGETEDQRDSGDADRFTLGQLSSALAGVAASAMDRLVIAYEPVWAIGTGRTATPADAQSMHAAIRAALISQYDDSIADSIRIQYGGSMKSANAADLCSCPDVDGGLIGGASLQAEDFAAIVRAAADASVTLEKAEQS
ncbi:MAG: triose-phosphate isomerase [Phycisphaerales bacterium]|nr:triose-phosphate isomerase [Phycisphaerales bacterium]